MNAMPDADLNEIRLIETLAMRAWPAEESVVLWGWQLRFSQGITRRANSVWPNSLSLPTSDEPEIGALLDAVETRYAAHNLPVRYQICPAALPVDLDRRLAGRGYAAVAPTHVQAVDLRSMIDRTARTLSDGGRQVRIESGWTEPWFDAYREAEGFGGHEANMRRVILSRIQAPAAYALLLHGSIPLAIGLGVVEEGYLGIFSMATVPAHRRQGAATKILHALGRWGREHGASRAYLQVMVQNKPAQALYARAGFATLYDYHYRELHRD